MNQHRFFRTSDASLYEHVRLTLDEAWGLPDIATMTTTCIDPADVAPTDGDGRIVLGVREDFCSYTVIVDLLPQLLASGAVEEIDEGTYRAAVDRLVP